MRAPEGGYTLAEALSALVVAGLLTLALAAVLAVVGRTAMRQAEAAASAETERTAPAILATELRALTAADAWFGSDSVRLRAFRGGGVVCARSGSQLTIAYDGYRQPEAAKDSVLLIWEEGEAAHPLAAVLAPAVCDGATALRLDVAGLGGSGARPLLAFVFETGAYSVSASALRYRRGAAGRQPLTEETLTEASSLRAVAAHPPSTEATVARLVLYARDGGVAPGLEWALRLPQGGVTPQLVAP